MTIGEFKERVASVVVGDEPWDTSLVWADAQIDLPELDEVERARVVVDLLVELLDDGLVEYFVVSNFNVEGVREGSCAIRAADAPRSA